MKLRNKKTGEIGTLTLSSNGEDLLIMKNNEMVTHSVKLSDLEDWEDYEEPKEYWYLSGRGEIRCIEDDGVKFDEDHKEIGNYFETKEEADKAVAKLKAWKRLKDKGFRFKRWTIPEEPKTPHIKLVIEAEMDVPDSPYDLDLLFGGE